MQSTGDKSVFRRRPSTWLKLLACQTAAINCGRNSPPRASLHIVPLGVFTVSTTTSTNLFDYRLRHLLGAHANNQLVSMVSTTVSGTEARDFCYKIWMMGRIVRDGWRGLAAFYTWFVTYPNGQFSAVDYAHFINSFKIVAAPWMFSHRHRVNYFLGRTNRSRSILAYVFLWAVPNF